MFNFEKLAVWQKSVAFAGDIYRVSRTFPPAERFSLTDQIRRAATSVAANVAEGSARSRGDFARFVGYAAGSLYEVVTQSTIAFNIRILSEADFRRIYANAEEIGRMLSGLRKSLEE
jgi:four helix bundle protein